jgi:hypothetical protein
MAEFVQRTPPTPPQGEDATVAPYPQAIDEPAHSQLTPDKLPLAVRKCIASEVARQLFQSGHPGGPAAGVPTGAADLVTLKEILRYMPPKGRSESTVRRWQRQGRIPAEKIGGVWYFEPSKVEEALRSERCAGERIRDAIGVWTAHQKKLKKAPKWPRISQEKS